MSADQAELGHSLKLNEAEDAVQKIVAVGVGTRSRTYLLPCHANIFSCHGSARAAFISCPLLG